MWFNSNAQKLLHSLLQTYYLHSHYLLIWTHALLKITIQCDIFDFFNLTALIFKSQLWPLSVLNASMSDRSFSLSITYQCPIDLVISLDQHRCYFTQFTPAVQLISTITVVTGAFLASCGISKSLFIRNFRNLWFILWFLRLVQFLLWMNYDLLSCLRFTALHALFTWFLLWLNCNLYLHLGFAALTCFEMHFNAA